MPWFRIDDGWHSHPKVIEAGNAAAGLWVRIGSYCSQYATDGYIPARTANQLGAKRELTRLQTVGLLVAVEGGYLIPDFNEYNPSAEQVKAQRKATAERQKRWREQRSSNAVTDAVTDDARNAVTNAAHSLPVPSLSVITSSCNSQSQSGDPVDDVIRHVAHELARRVGKGNHAGYLAATRRNVDRDAVAAMLERDPSLADRPQVAAAFFLGSRSGQVAQ
jgi:hypothetical protein